eukprot:m.384266 g.384266  ORF g.384266 m.384266 type:complete len:242 (-) comp56269_c0_seq7:873-1598(-)
MTSRHTRTAAVPSAALEARVRSLVLSLSVPLSSSCFLSVFEVGLWLSCSCEWMMTMTLMRTGTVSRAPPSLFAPVALSSFTSSMVAPAQLGLLVAALTLGSVLGLVDVFTAGENGYFCIKIPVLLTTQNGTLIAMGEARKPDCSDYTWTDLVIKRSTDGGATWSPLEIFYSNSTEGDSNVIGNAAIVQDRQTGTIFVRSFRPRFRPSSPEHFASAPFRLTITVAIIDPHRFRSAATIWKSG